MRARLLACPSRLVELEQPREPFIDSTVRHLLSRLVLLVAVTAAPLAAQSVPLRIAYRVAMPDPSAHLYEIALDVDGIRGDSLPLQLPVWSPGRYAKMDFAKNIQDFTVTDAKGARLQPIMTRKQTWRVDTKGRRSTCAAIEP